MTDTCTNIEHNSCSSVERGEVPDMRLGDTCILCCCWECERCDETIDLDCEIQVNDFVAGAHNLGDPASAGYIAVCEKCVTKEDTLYDN